MPRFRIKALFFVTTFVAAAIAVAIGGEAAAAVGSLATGVANGAPAPDPGEQR